MDALRHEPINVAAAAALGLNADATGDPRRARRAFAYAERLSRRDSATQLWAIEDAVGRGDISNALRHYDIALRVKPELGGLLFPVLLGASEDPTIRHALVHTLAAKPSWGEAFVNFAASKISEPRAVATLFRDLRGRGFAIPPAATASLVNALFSAGLFDDAWNYYRLIRNRADRSHSRDPRFRAHLDVPTLFDWTPVNESGVVATIESGVFDFSAPASVGGTMLQQIQVLPPGGYVLRGKSSNIDQPAAARPYWALACHDGRELGRVEVPSSTSGGEGHFGGTFRVPPDCPVQTLILVARASDAISGLSGQINQAALIPAR